MYRWHTEKYNIFTKKYNLIHDKSDLQGNMKFERVFDSKTPQVCGWPVQETVSTGQGVSGALTPHEAWKVFRFIEV
jgi:hypothetical protein